MNISFQPTNTVAATDYYTPPTTDGRPRRCAGRTSGNYDTVSISKSQPVADDSCFACVLARKTAKEITYEASPEQVQSISRQIHSGTYKPDPERIAERLLGYH